MPNHNSVANMTEEERITFGKVITRGVLLSFGQGSWAVSDEWNRLTRVRFIRLEQWSRDFGGGKATVPRSQVEPAASNE